MIALEQLRGVLTPGDKLILVNGNPVWDYKAIGNELFLISEKEEGISPEDYVTAAEILDFCKDVWQEGEEFDIISEQDGTKLNIIETETLNFKQK